ncbi:MAG: tRNA pseudouridine synthase [Clostridia bacterium]|nr:tRNA pseudouridine synthase [Clostridia bacterium]
MTNYLIRIQYDGSAYSGYQQQINGLAIGELILKALKSIFGQVFELKGCSRTDKGVHALDFCVSFKTEKQMGTDNLIKALNFYLPRDIVVFDCQYVPDNFHARYDVTSKEYIYKIYNKAYRSPFYDKYMLFIPYPLDLDSMNRAAALVCGKHDFSAFMAAGSDIDECIRTVFYANFTRDDDIVTFRIAADGFLYKMVRIIVGNMIAVSQGKIKADEITDIIEKKKANAGTVAPALGLYLNKVYYKCLDNLL